MRIIIDENIPRLIIESLSSKGFKIVSIFDKCRGIDDFGIIQLAQQEDNAIILTEDKDFGEWVFAHHIKNISVVFLRYHFTELNIISIIVIKLFAENQDALLNKFTTITTKKIRTRDII